MLTYTLCWNFLMAYLAHFSNFVKYSHYAETYSFVNTLRMDNWERKGVEEKIFLLGFHTNICYDLDIWPRNLFQHYVTLDLQYSICEVLDKYDQQESKYASDKEIHKMVFLTLSFDLGRLNRYKSEQKDTGSQLIAIEHWQSGVLNQTCKSRW